MKEKITCFFTSPRTREYLREKSLFFDKIDKFRQQKTEFTLVINETRKFQKILGLGYSFEHSSCYNLGLLPKNKRDKTINLLVNPIKGAGMNLWRLCIGTSDFTGTPWYTYDDIPPEEEDLDLQQFSIEKDQNYIIPIVKRAQTINPDLKFFASPWSPPAWMKSSKKICGGKLLPDYYNVYAQYFYKYIKAYEKAGIPIYAITVQNEPGVDNEKMPSCKWTAEEEKTFIRDHLGPLFEKKQIKTKIWCYDHNFGFVRKPAKYPEIILRDKEAAEYIDGIAYHHYGGIPKYMRLLKEKFPHINLYFTEGSVFGLKGAQKLAKYFLNGVKSYNGWVPFIDSNKGPNNGPHRCKNTIIQLKKPENHVLINFDYFLLIHYTKFIQEGAYHIFSEGLNKRKISEISFLNPDNSIISIITNNRLRDAKIGINWHNKYTQILSPKKSITTICINKNK